MNPACFPALYPPSRLVGNKIQGRASHVHKMALYWQRTYAHPLVCFNVFDDLLPIQGQCCVNGCYTV